MDKNKTSLEHAVAVAKTALAFGLIERATRHIDGTSETDSTHTVMLAMLVADLARAEGLDVGLAVQYAIVHDLPETYAGDTCTARALSSKEKKAKDMRESESLDRILDDLGKDCWTSSMIEKYEKQEDPESHLVRYVDKILPKLTHIINGGSAYEKLGMTADEVEINHSKQHISLCSQYPNLPFVKTLFEESCDAALSEFRKSNDKMEKEIK